MKQFFDWYILKYPLNTLITYDLVSKSILVEQCCSKEDIDKAFEYGCSWIEATPNGCIKFLFK